MLQLPIDPLFLLLPALATRRIAASRKLPTPHVPLERRSFRHDSRIEPSLRDSPSGWGRHRDLLEARLGAICDTVEAGDEKMFRLNGSKLLGEILSKARRLTHILVAAEAWRKSSSQKKKKKKKKKVLEAPIVGIKTSPSGQAADAGSFDGSQGRRRRLKSTRSPLSRL